MTTIRTILPIILFYFSARVDRSAKSVSRSEGTDWATTGDNEPLVGGVERSTCGWSPRWPQQLHTQKVLTPFSLAILRIYLSTFRRNEPWEPQNYVASSVLFIVGATTTTSRWEYSKPLVLCRQHQLCRTEFRIGASNSVTRVRCKKDHERRIEV